MKGNRVFINDDGVIEIIVNGDQTVESVQAMGDQALALAQVMQKKGRPALILDNLLLMGSVPPEARRLVADLIKSQDYDRLAMLGHGTALRLGANLILQATGKGKRVKYFEDREKATAWLTTV
jgi:UDP-N-acetylmuramyl pentapeptide synthase